MAKISSVQVIKGNDGLVAVVGISQGNESKEVRVPLGSLGEALFKGNGEVSFSSIVSVEETEQYRDDWSGKLQSSTTIAQKQVWTKTFVHVALDGRSGQIFADCGEDLAKLKAFSNALAARRSADEAAQKNWAEAFASKFCPKGKSFIIDKESGERIDVFAIDGEVWASYYRSHNANPRKWHGAKITSRDIAREDWLRWLANAGLPMA